MKKTTGARVVKPVIKKGPLKYPNTLPKMWHKFLIMKDFALLTGEYCLMSKRYGARQITGQGAATCVVACAMADLIKAPAFTSTTINQILDLGAVVHSDSLQIEGNKCRPRLDPEHITKYFFVDQSKIGMKTGIGTILGQLSLEEHPRKALLRHVRRFFGGDKKIGIFSSQRKYFAIWYADKYVVFDPRDHAPDGRPWLGVTGEGVACCLALPTVDRLSDWLYDQLTKTPKIHYKIYNCVVENVTKINVEPPEVLPVLRKNQLEAKASAIKKGPTVKTKKKSPAVGATAKAKPGADQKGGGEPQVSESDTRVPPKRPHVEDKVKFTKVTPVCNILRATRHQCHRELSHLKDQCQELSLSNAMASLIYWRNHRMRQWSRKALDEILKLGVMIYYNSKTQYQEKGPQKVEFEGNAYTAVMDKLGQILGRLESNRDSVLDLKPALDVFLAENECGIIRGPLTIAVWTEGSLFYMFDPNARSATAGPLGHSDEEGLACVTCWKTTAGLAECYTSNVPLHQRKDIFGITKVEIKDYVPLLADWHNFLALGPSKWILRGHYSQFDRRFNLRNVQCTAMAQMAITYAELMGNESSWTRDTVDRVLDSGDDLYLNVVRTLQEKGTFVDAHLAVFELPLHWHLGEDKQVDYKIDECLVNGFLKTSPDLQVPDLRQGLRQFFELGDAGIFTSGVQSVALWRRDDAFFVYDSHNRNPVGAAMNYGLKTLGAACLIRFLTLEDMCNSLLTNLVVKDRSPYNLGRVAVKIFEKSEDGVVKQPLNSYQALSDFVAILRAETSENDAGVFDMAAGKLTISSYLACLIRNVLRPASEWLVSDIDLIFDQSRTIYAYSVAECQKVQAEETGENFEVPEEIVPVTIDTSNVHTVYTLGKNKCEIQLEDLSQGTIENLADPLEQLLESSKDNPEDFQAILESQYTTLAMWRDDHSFYVFDSRPRDPRGNIFGRDDWTLPPPPEEENEEGDEEQGDESPNRGDQDKKDEDEDEDDDEGGGGDYQPGRIRGGADEDEQELEVHDDMEGDDDEEEEGDDGGPRRDKKGSAHWRGLEQEGGRACVLRFARLEDLLSHVKENNPPTKLGEIEYTLKSVKIVNTPLLLEKYDPEGGAEKKDEHSGDWNKFKEITYGNWILRASKHFGDKLYPEGNRGKQQLPMAFCALAYVFNYSLSKFEEVTVDEILLYGDRLYTKTQRHLAKELKKNMPDLSEDELRLLTETLTRGDYPEKYCIAAKEMTIRFVDGVTQGHVRSEDPATILDLPNGLRHFFDSGHQYGLLSCRGLTVAVWKAKNVYYMFDPSPRGPSGRSPCQNGVAAITRFKEPEDFAETFLSNLPELGDGVFEIDAVELSSGECQRERQPDKVVPVVPKIGGFAQVAEGKSILRADIRQDGSKFQHGFHVESYPIAVAALATSLILKADTWTTWTVNEVLLLGDDLFMESVRKFNGKFNPHNNIIDAKAVANDFYIGTQKANFTLRHMDQRGLVDVKNNPKYLNLRQGLQRFFHENTHGILTIGDRLALALWEEENGDETSIYIYDPNPRGASGMPTHGGSACVVKFCNAVLAFEHLKALLSSSVDKSKLPFDIVPLELVIGGTRTAKKVRKGPKADPNLKPGICPTKAEIEQERRQLRTFAEEERQKKNVREQNKLGRNAFHKISDDEYLLRGLTSVVDLAAVTTNICFYIFTQMLKYCDKFNCKIITLVLEAGYQLYIDSHATHKPPTATLPIDAVLRDFVIKKPHCRIRIDLSKVLYVGQLEAEVIVNFLSHYFLSSNMSYGILIYEGQFVSVLVKEGFYYYFDPYARGLDGKKCPDGSAVMMRFPSLEVMVMRIVQNLAVERPKSRVGLLPVRIQRIEFIDKKR